jgi:calcineurin-like phosphoesterase
MRLAFFGDVVGRSGREGLATHLPGLRRRLGLEFVVVNAENAATASASPRTPRASCSRPAPTA